LLVSAEQNNCAYWAWRSVVHVFRWPAELPAHIVYLDLVAGRAREPYVTESAKAARPATFGCLQIYYACDAIEASFL